MPHNTLSHGKKVLFGCVLLSIILVIGELVALLALRIIPGHVYYRLPQDDDFKAYRALMHKPNFSPSLGWLPKPQGITPQGYRISPAGTGLEKVASVYGDSFAFAHDVGHEQAWPNVLSKLLGKKVENYGVNFYSSGQALLRFIENIDDKPQIAILVMMSENIVRNINQNSSFIYSPTLMFRPVWFQDADSIALEPLPDVATMDAQTYLSQERQLLHYEYFWPESSPLAKRRIHFPYLLTLPRAILLNRRITSGLLDELGVHGPAWYQPLYDPEHPSGAYELTLRIFERFVAVARQRGIQRAIILFVPRDRDINHFRATGTWGYEQFWEDARARCPEFYTLSDYIARDFADKGDNVIKEYFHTPRLRLGRDQRERGGHYSAQGNAYLAHVMNSIILKN